MPAGDRAFLHEIKKLYQNNNLMSRENKKWEDAGHVIRDPGGRLADLTAGRVARRAGEILGLQDSGISSEG